MMWWLGKELNRDDKSCGRKKSKKETDGHGNKDGALERIEVTTHDWFHSAQMQEWYHYEEGNFEAYPQKKGSKFYAHHYLKVLPEDAR